MAVGPKWIEAWDDPMASMRAVSPYHLALADVAGDGDAKLVVVNEERKLQVLRGTTLERAKDVPLLGEPSAICIYHPDDRVPAIPALAVAIGPNIYVYRNLRPFFKFSLPPLPVEGAERSAWEAFLNGKTSILTLHAKLVELRDSKASLPLTAPSTELLTAELRAGDDEWNVELLRGMVRELGVSLRSLRRFDLVTCLTRLPYRLAGEESAQSCLVVGTESGRVLVLSPDLSKGEAATEGVFQLPCAPAHLSAIGAWTVESRILATGRDGKVYSVRNGKLHPGPLVEPALGARFAFPSGTKSIFVVESREQASLYTPAGRCSHTIALPCPVAAVCPILRDGASLTVLALADGDVRVYRGREVISATGPSPDIEKDPPNGLIYGRFGREDRTLLLLQESGHARALVLPRTVDLISAPPVPKHAGPPPEQDRALELPRRTRLYMLQAEREKEEAAVMHKAFQSDLCVLRLEAAKAYVKLVSGEEEGGVLVDGGVALRGAAEVRGMGPGFELALSFENTGSKLAPTEGKYLLAIDFDAEHYHVTHPQMPVPNVAPGATVTLTTPIRCIHPDGGVAQKVKALLLRVPAAESGLLVRPKPALVLTITMPLAQDTVEV